jgi:hypothetical protein
MKFKVILILVLVLASALPALAQDNGMHTVAFDGFRFSYDSSLATGVNIWQDPGDPPDFEAPGGAQVRSTFFVLYNTLPVPESFYDAAGGIRVYQTADFAGYSFYEERLAQLQSLLAGRPDLAGYMVPNDDVSANELPLLPVFPAGQIIRAQAQYVDTPSVAGIRFVTVYRQDVFPFMGNEFLYTFQGLSLDGTRYVSVIVRLTTGLFPMEVPADFDYNVFIAGIDQYFADSIATLNGAAPDAFAPSLTTLDALVQSIGFEG